MSNENELHAEKESECDALFADLRQAMLMTEENEGGIKNAGSFAMTILWQMYEDAKNYLERYNDFSSLGDDKIEEMLKKLFPQFISEYPAKMSLANVESTHHHR